MINFSQVYYSVQSQRLNIRRSVYGFAARAILAKAGFERFTQDNKEPVLHRKQLAEHLEHAFEHLVGTVGKKDELGDSYLSVMQLARFWTNYPV